MSSLKTSTEKIPISPGFEWRWNIGILIFAGVFLPLTIALGIWQLQRADQKREMLAEHEQRRQADPVALSALDPAEDHQYRRVRVQGQPDSKRYFLLDNRTRRGRAGYEVLWPVQIENQQWILINRGWIAGGLDRRELPEVPDFDASNMSGYLYQSKGKALVLGEQEKVKGWPQVIQQVDMALLESRFGSALFPYVLRQDEMIRGGTLKPGWIIVNVLPAKHTAYAVQWFAMAIALLILSVITNSNLGECLQHRRKHSRKYSGKHGRGEAKSE